jgi:hypothetical protein
MPIYLRTGEDLPNTTKEALKNANDNLSRTRNNSNYISELTNIFGYIPRRIGLREKNFLGGFIEGDGEINVSAKKLRNAAHGIHIDPEFSITQHVNSVDLLILACSFFQTGRIRYKAGSKATLVFIIDNRDSLENKVVTFYKKYINPMGSAVKTTRLKKFEKILAHIRENHHQDLDILVNSMLPLWDSMRMQTGQRNKTFASLEQAQAYARNPRL